MPSRLVPRSGSRRPYKRLVRSLLQQREGFKAINTLCMNLNEELLVDIARLNARPEFAFSFRPPGAGVTAAPAAAAAAAAAATTAAEEEISSEQLDFDFAAWIDQALLADDEEGAAGGQQIENLLPPPPATTTTTSAGEVTMADDSAELTRLREENADLISRFESYQTQLANYEEQAQFYQETVRLNESLRQDLQSEKAKHQRVEHSLEHFQLQYRNERANLAQIIYPGQDFPDHQSVHEHVGNAIDQLRRDLTTHEAVKGDLELELNNVKTQISEANARSQNLQQQNETIQTQLDASIAKFQGSLTVTEAQQAVSDAVADLSAQCEEAQLDTEALREENANQKEELENLRRFRDQYSSPTARHRRNPSSRPGSMILASTNLEDEISSAAVSGDDAEDALSLLPPQPQDLGLSDLMTVSVAPTASPLQPLAFSALTTQEVKPRQPAHPALSFSSITTQEVEPRSPPQPIVDLSSNMTKDLEPDGTPESTLGFSTIMSQEVQPISPKPVSLSFSKLSEQFTIPKRVFRMRLTPPKSMAEIEATYARLMRPRFRFSEITTIYEQAPSPGRQIPVGLPPPQIPTIPAPTATKHATKSVASQADVPRPRPQMGTSATAISLILALLFILLLRVCATRFAFYNAMRTANSIKDWHAGDLGYSVVSYIMPYRPSLGLCIHDAFWGLMHLIFQIFGAGHKASLIHYRVATWWSSTTGAGLF